MLLNETAGPPPLAVDDGVEGGVAAGLLAALGGRVEFCSAVAGAAALQLVLLVGMALA